MAVDTPGSAPAPQSPQTQDPDAFQTAIYIAHIPWVCDASSLFPHYLFHSRHVTVSVCALSLPQTNPQWKSEQEVREIVEKFGEVKSCVIGECRANGKSRGFAKVTFAHPGCACVAKKELDGSTAAFPDGEKPLVVAYPKGVPGAPVVPPAAMVAMNKMFMGQMPPMPGMPPMPMGMQMPPMGMPMPPMNMPVPGAPQRAPTGDSGASLLPFPANR